MKRPYPDLQAAQIDQTKKPKLRTFKKRKFFTIYKREHTSYISSDAVFDEELFRWKKAGEIVGIEMSNLTPSMIPMDDSVPVETKCLNYLSKILKDESIFKK